MKVERFFQGLMILGALAGGCSEKTPTPSFLEIKVTACLDQNGNRACDNHDWPIENLPLRVVDIADETIQEGKTGKNGQATFEVENKQFLDLAVPNPIIEKSGFLCAPQEPPSSTIKENGKVKIQIHLPYNQQNCRLPKPTKPLQGFNPGNPFASGRSKPVI